jgi:thiamine kinase-like enzyme
MSTILQTEKRLKAVLNNWQEYGLASMPVLDHTFSAGLNHSAYLLHFENLNNAADRPHMEKVVLKIFSIAMPNAIFAQSGAAELGLAPEIIFINKEKDLVLMEYIETPFLGSNTIGNDELAQLGSALQRLHSAPTQALCERLGDFDLLTFCGTYFSGLDDNILEIHKKIKPVLDAFIDDPTPWTLCHNDLVQENCFINQGQVSFIDWEFAQRHNPWFDLAAIVMYTDLSLEQATLLHENYKEGWGSKTDSPIFYQSQCALLWGDMLWHLDKFGMSYSSSMTHKWHSLGALGERLSVDLFLSPRN